MPVVKRRFRNPRKKGNFCVFATAIFIGGVTFLSMGCFVADTHRLLFVCGMWDFQNCIVMMAFFCFHPPNFAKLLESYHWIGIRITGKVKGGVTGYFIPARL